MVCLNTTFTDSSRIVSVLPLNQFFYLLSGKRKAVRKGKEVASEERDSSRSSSFPRPILNIFTFLCAIVHLSRGS